jgi:hypothetical protein
VATGDFERLPKWALARELQITHQAISKWEPTPAVRVLEIERITGASRYQIRPEVYGPEPKLQK